jgi:hypothetical protein
MAKKDTEGTHVLYAVSEEHRKVVAYIPDGYTDIFDEVLNKIYKINPYVARTFERSNQARAMILAKNMSAEAVCHPDDTWNEERGKAIARTRLLRHKSRVRLRLYDVAWIMIQNWALCVGELFEKEFKRCDALDAELTIHLENIRQG